MEERARRRGKRDWRFVRLEKTSFPKTVSPLDSKFLKKKNEEKGNREERLCRSEKTPEGSVVRWLLKRERECERGEERGDDNGMEREWR